MFLHGTLSMLFIYNTLTYKNSPVTSGATIFPLSARTRTASPTCTNTSLYPKETRASSQKLECAEKSSRVWSCSMWSISMHQPMRGDVGFASSEVICNQHRAAVRSGERWQQWTEGCVIDGDVQLTACPRSLNASYWSALSPDFLYFLPKEMHSCSTRRTRAFDVSQWPFSTTSVSHTTRGSE